MRVLYLITARGGSKGIPKKNLCKIEGISLVGYKAISSHQSKYCTRLMVSTEDPEIQADAETHDVEVPFTRPAELATDTASSMDVISHVIDWIEGEGTDVYDAVMLLEPSSPFARWFDYDRAVEMMIEKDANAVVAVRPMEVSSVYVGPLDREGRITSIIDKMRKVTYAVRRQGMQAEYTANGALYLMRWDYLKQFRDIYHDRDGSFGYIMDEPYGLEIDHPIDLQWARFLVQTGMIDISHWKDE